jgi:serine carboxypeptidase 1
MIYEGQDDIICNTPCTENFIDKLDWAGSDDFRNADYNPWMENKATVGTHKVGGNLTFVVVNKAGHMVPRD